MLKNILEVLGVVALVYLNVIIFGFAAPALISANDYSAVALGFLTMILIVAVDYKVITQLVSTHLKS